MAKKVRAKYTSKGERPNVAKHRKVTNADRSPAEVTLNKWRAFVAGRNVVFTIPNPNEKETAKRFIRVSGKDLYGDYRKYATHYGM